MLTLGTTDILEVVRSTTETLDCFAAIADIVDATQAVEIPDPSSAVYSTAATSTLVAAPAAGRHRNINTLYVVNVGAADNVITVRVNRGGGASLISLPGCDNLTLPAGGHVTLDETGKVTITQASTPRNVQIFTANGTWTKPCLLYTSDAADE